MKVILSKDIAELGKKGQVVEVSEGYARNFLLPRKLAMPATLGTTKALVQEREAQERKKTRELTQATQLAARLSALELRIPAKVGEAGRLFGSVTTADIAAALAARGITLDKRRIELKEAIKVAGRYQVEVKVYPEVSARLAVDVVPE